MFYKVILGITETRRSEERVIGSGYKANTIPKASKDEGRSTDREVRRKDLRSISGWQSKNQKEP